MRDLILVSKTPIVIQIFNLVCKKLSINIKVLNDTNIDHKVDILVIDKEFIDDGFSILKTYTKQIGAITNEELSFEMANDFSIPSPFLPSTLEVILQEQLSIIAQKMNTKTYVTSTESVVDDDPFVMDSLEPLLEDDTGLNDDGTLSPDLGLDEDLEPAMEYLDTIADDIAMGINEENDDSIVSTVSVDKGGILDRDELSKIEGMIDLGSKPSLNKIENSMMEDIDLDENNADWQDLSEIIDQAIYEVNSTEQIETFDPSTKPIELKLNNYTLEELRPLLGMLDQDIIDSITEGNEIMLKLKLESNNGQ
jgi:hypothetical protein